MHYFYKQILNTYFGLLKQKYFIGNNMLKKLNRQEPAHYFNIHSLFSKASNIFH